MKLTQDQKDECINIRKSSNKKRKHPDDEKIAALESMIEEQNKRISALTSSTDGANASENVNLPPPPTRNPLQPPSGFTQRQSRVTV